MPPVTLTLIQNDGVSQDLTEIPNHNTDELILDFQADGCFCAEHPDDFNPPLPNGFCARGSHPEHFRALNDHHYTIYTWDTRQHCSCPDREHHEGRHRIGMHAIHTGT
jgi:hypothetical protein